MKKTISILWYLSAILLILFFPLAFICEFFPSIVPDSVFYPFFYAQWPIIASFIITSIFKDKCNQ